jgi:hypothetical protein
MPMQKRAQSAILDRFSFVLLLRSLTRIGRQIDARLATQNQYLKQLADKFAPDLSSEPVGPQIRSVDYSEDREQRRILDYIERTVKDIGREPTEEELITHLDGGS